MDGKISSNGMEKELVELKIRVMINRIDKLSSIFKLLGKEAEYSKLKDITKKYIESYNEILETEKFELYKDIENEVIREVAPIELSLDEYIRKTAVKYQDTIEQIIQKIVDSREYKYFEDLDAILEEIKALKALIKLYAPYINREKVQEGLRKASEVKFNTLLKKQALALVYGNEENSSFLTEYENESEKTYFEQLIIKEFGFMLGINIYNESVQYSYAEITLKNKNQRLDILLKDEMRINPKAYIGLLNAKIFNPHLCNIELKGMPEENEYTAKRNRANFLLLYAILSNLISNENTSIIECEKIYKRFGFRCRPLILNERQRIVKELFDEVKDTELYKEMIEKPEEPNGKKKKYCRIKYIYGLIPNFYYDDKIDDIDFLLLTPNSTLIYDAKRKIGKIEEQAKRLTRIQTSYSIRDTYGDNLMLTRHIFYYRTGRLPEMRERLSKLIERLEKQKESDDIQSIRQKLLLRCQMLVELNEPLWEWKNGEFIVPEKKKNDLWRLLPLEDIVENEIEEGENATIRHFFKRRFIFAGNAASIVDMISNVWKEDKESFEELGLDIKRYGTGVIDLDKVEEQICINLQDIADLPLDKEGLEMVTEEEIARAGEKGEQER